MGMSAHMIALFTLPVLLLPVLALFDDPKEYYHRTINRKPVQDGEPVRRRISAAIRDPAAAGGGGGAPSSSK